jgi:hypothetical protein
VYEFVLLTEAGEGSSNLPHAPHGGDLLVTELGHGGWAAELKLPLLVHWHPATA